MNVPLVKEAETLIPKQRGNARSIMEIKKKEPYKYCSYLYSAHSALKYKTRSFLIHRTLSP